MIGNFVGSGIGVPGATAGVQDGVGASASVAVAAFVGGTFFDGVAASAGVAADSFIGASTHAGTAASVGVAAAPGVGDAVKETVGASAGVATCLGVGEQEGVGVASAAGIATVLGVGLAPTNKVTDTVILEKPVDFWLPESQTGTPGRPGQLSRELFRSVFNE